MPLPSRRALLTGTIVAGVGAVLTACSGSDDGSAGAGGTASASGATIDTLFGEVQVPADPRTLIALGWGDAETVLALGGQVVATSDWLGFGGDGVGPWAQDLVTREPEQLGTQELSYEKIAALEPDVILNTRQSNAEAVQAELTKIAPTVGPPPGLKTSYGTPWRDQVHLVAAALGKQDEGAKLVSDLEAEFTRVAAANPAFAGRTVAVAAFYSGKFGAYVTGDGRVDFMTELGFTQSPKVQALAKDDSFYVELSDEQLDQLDADLVVVFPIGATAAEITANPGIQNLPATKDGRIVVFDDTTLSNAFSSGTTLGLGYALDHAVPLFAQALA
ncbi:iron-siderophore ABC transporter substrate-binding protein [Kineococcus rhizosphaerae]|uniref:Iron complex transport system substrate-binding protein n=1 Tax=Kineococcus rhizosphaerae TaxID=559628 RepID=A0A2T0R6T3_9ACTN|nr:iron-siderophore ABC transporter substrate-binding protein [Kineococcus rhizosphaerae]PRY16885.1 iron complex transport system substrate-binding protein [Kineococcus rhizosphaerae]